MQKLKKYADEFGVHEVTNDYGECNMTSETNIIFPNGWVASIVRNNGVSVHSHGECHTVFKSNKKYSVAMCDYNGYFDWSILNQFGAIDGCLYCDKEDETIAACEIIRKL